MSWEPRHYEERFELKYLMRTADRGAVLARLHGFLGRDFGLRTEDQSVFSLYFDTPTLEFYWDKLDGEEVRQKLRLRGYRPCPDGPFDALFIERKLKINQTIRKVRVQLPADYSRMPLADLVRSGELNALAPFEASSRTQVLVPSSMHQYRRAAVESPRFPHLRITIDSWMRVQPARDLMLDFSQAPFGLPPHLSVLELKYSRKLPSWVTSFVQAHGLSLMRVSKYVLAVRAVARELHRGRNAVQLGAATEKPVEPIRSPGASSMELAEV